MKDKHLQPKRALRTVLFVLLLSAAGMTKLYASYDFSAVCETGQTLYYNIIDAENRFVELTHPGSGQHYYSWSGFTKPTGNIILPTNVQYDGVTYTVTSIGDYAFYECSGLTGTLTIPNSVISIGDLAFNNCSNFIGALVIPDSVTSIGLQAFGLLEKITSLTIPNSITSISDWTFCYCNELSSVNIPNSVTSIGAFAFAYSSKLASITIGNSVTSIGEHAFSLCSRLTSVFIPNSVTSIGENPFDQCSSLGQIVVGSGNSAYDSRNNCNAIIHTSTNCLISGCKNTVIPNTITSIGNDAFLSCSGMTGTLTIPNSVTSIGDFAFSGCWNLTGELIIPSSVTTIGRYAFHFCLGLTGTLTIPNSVISIGERAFGWCSGIEQMIVDSENPVYDSRDSCNAIIQTYTNRLIFGCKNTIIPNTVTSIGNYAFEHCQGLTSITIGNSVTSIGNYAFLDCTGLTSISVLANNPPTLYHSFEGVTIGIPVYVPCGSAEAYQSAAYWRWFTNIQEVCTQTQTIELAAGWNWFSTYLDITLDDLKDALMEALPGTAITIKSQTQNTSYNPNSQRWVGSMTWDVAKMYSIKTAAPCEITLVGIPINPIEHPITIVNGVNWIGFPLNQSMSLTNAFTGFAVSGDKIKAQSGNALYNGSSWIGQMTTLEPGKGYIYNSADAEDRTFTFPASNK